jgi:hypothetical protein
MQIGLDYMQMRSRAQYYGLRWTGIGLMLVGVVLCAAGIAYYGYLFWLRVSVDDFAARGHGTILLETSPQGEDEGVGVSSVSLPSGTYSQRVAELGFNQMPSSAAWPVGTQPAATRLIVPSLGIDVKLDELSVTGSSIVSYASGDNPAAGYSTVSANPGERGAMWLFGPAGQGTHSFSSLTRSGELLKDGREVLMFVNTAGQNYLYAATHSEVIPASDLRLNSTDRATVHLVVPVPSGLYDHFLVLSGELVGVK